jgi:hypothetical protein
MPGSSPTMDRRAPVNLLNSVDLPTFGRPMITTVGGAVTPLACNSIAAISLIAIYPAGREFYKD